MAIPTTGAISASTINSELGRASGDEISFNDAIVRSMAGNIGNDSQISLGTFRGKDTFLRPNNTDTVTIDSTVTFQRSTRNSNDTTNSINFTTWPNNRLSDPTMSWLGTPQVFSGSVTAVSSNNLEPILNSSTSRLRIPEGCARIVIRTWGAGGGSGGVFFNPNTSLGGAGGYATTELFAGTHFTIGQILCCMAGPAGSGSQYAPWGGGNGGAASAVWLFNGSFRFSELQSQYTSSTIVLIAGGGGGGGARNTSTGTAPNAGASGSDGQSTPLFSGSGTGATSTAHGQGTYSYSSNQWHGANQAGIGTNRSLVLPEYTWANLFSFSTVSQAPDEAQQGSPAWVVETFGGGGAFQGNGGGRIIANQSSNTQGRPGGGGASKVYLGSNQSVQSSGVSTTPPQSGSSGGKGFGGAGAGPRRDTPDDNSFTGLSGTPGRVIVQFFT
jgi:hypothetical protein